MKANHLKTGIWNIVFKLFPPFIQAVYLFGYLKTFLFLTLELVLQCCLSVLLVKRPHKCALKFAVQDCVRSKQTVALVTIKLCS